MSVSVTCLVPGGAVELSVGARQRIRYTLEAPAGVEAGLQNHLGEPLPLSGIAGRTHEWPADGAYPDRAFVTHTLGMQFVDEGEVAWRVELLDRSGNVLAVVKDCTYVNRDDADDFFDTFTIGLEP